MNFGTPTADMTQRWIAEVRLFGFQPLPTGWCPCDGTELVIAENQPLFAMVGWRFGGDGWRTFALPTLLFEEADLVFAIAIDGVIALRGEVE